MRLHHPAFFPEPSVDGPEVFFTDYCAKVLEVRAEAAKALGGLVHIHFEHKSYTLDLNQAKVFVSARSPDNDSVTETPGQIDLTMHMEDFKPMITGRCSLISLVQSGAARISGDLNTLATLAILLSG